MRPRRAAAALTLVLFAASVCAADDAASTAANAAASSAASTAAAAAAKNAPEPYGAEEFPLWARDLRRGEIIAFGSLPFTLFLFKYTSYAPAPLDFTESAPNSSVANGRVFLAGCGASVLFALVDHWIVASKRRKAQRLKDERPKAVYATVRGPIPADDAGETPLEMPPQAPSDAPAAAEPVPGNP